MMFLGINEGFWYGMIATGVITLVCCIIAWSMPAYEDKKETRKVND